MIIVKAVLRYLKLGVIVAIYAVYATPAFADVVVPDELSKMKPADAVKTVPEDASFADENGNIHKLADFRGTVLLVNLWATWCPPCIREMPDLDGLSAKMANKPFRVIALSQDRGGVKDVEGFFKKVGLSNLEIAVDPKGKVGRDFKIRGLPTSFVIDKSGKIVGKVEGQAKWDAPAVVDYFTALSAE